MISTRIRIVKEKLRRSDRWKQVKVSLARSRDEVVFIVKVALGVALGILIAAPHIAG